MFILLALLLALAQAPAAQASSTPAKRPFVGFADLAWSPDSRTLAFTEYGVAAVLFIDRAGGREHRVPTPGPVSYLSWRPDGRRLAFGMKIEANAAEQIFVMTPDGRGLAQLTHEPGRDTMPAWSPDGRRIAFGSNRSGRLQLYVMAANGSDVRQLATSPNSLYTPQWSAKAGRIVFYSDAGDHKDQVWTVRPDGSDLRNETRGEGHNFYPAWSPDGRSLIFTREAQDLPGIFRLDLSTGALGRIAGADAYLARWSPDGRSIAFLERARPEAGSGPSLVVTGPDGAKRRVLAMLQAPQS